MVIARLSTLVWSKRWQTENSSKKCFKWWIKPLRLAVYWFVKNGIRLVSWMDIIFLSSNVSEACPGGGFWQPNAFFLHCVNFILLTTSYSVTQGEFQESRKNSFNWSFLFHTVIILSLSAFSPGWEKGIQKLSIPCYNCFAVPKSQECQVSS